MQIAVANTTITNYFQHESASQRHPPQHICETSRRNADIGNFNIEINISSNDATDEDMFD